MDYENFSSIFKAMADETRLKIIGLLTEGELCACKILEHFEITQPTLSYHMKILTECALVCAVKDGSWIKYSLNMHKFNDLKTLSENLMFKLNLLNGKTETGDCDIVCLPEQAKLEGVD